MSERERIFYFFTESLQMKKGKLQKKETKNKKHGK
jgi:hypothetical protein